MVLWVDVSAYSSFNKYKIKFLIIKIKHDKYQSGTINNPHTPKATVTKYYDNKLKSDYYYCYLLQAERKAESIGMCRNITKRCRIKHLTRRLPLQIFRQAVPSNGRPECNRRQKWNVNRYIQTASCSLCRTVARSAPYKKRRPPAAWQADANRSETRPKKSCGSGYTINVNHATAAICRDCDYIYP